MASVVGGTGSASPKRRPSHRRLVRAYLLGLAIIACAVTSTFFILSAVISAQSESAWMINVSGRQRMLSQRIALQLGELVHSQDAAQSAELRDDLQHDIALLLSSHEALVEASGGREGMSQPLRALYFERINAVDEAVRRYAADAQALSRQGAGTQRVDRAQALSRLAKTTLLNGLNAVVLQLQIEAEERVNALQRLEFTVYLITLLGLLGEGLWVFQPTLMELRRRARELELLSYQASHDELTGLPNRRFFLEYATTTLAVAARKGHRTGILHVDLDGFKAVNDGLGHAAGDEVLRRVSTQLRESVRDGDFIARLGGDEFVILVADVQSPLELERSAARLIGALERSARESPGAPHAGASIGLALVAPGERSIDPLMQQSDRALYRAKSAGKSRWSWSTQSPAPST